MVDMWDYIKKYDVISFDIFDTLVKRNAAHPKDIFDIVEYEFNQNNNEKISDFRNARSEAEKRARLNTLKEEITLEEIYHNFSQYPEGTLKKLIQLEVDTEVKYCIPNYNLLDLYKRCLESSKTVILTSDMYLSREVIERILSKCELAGYIKLFLSSEVGLKKGTGSLYDYVLKELDIKPRQMLHIGDGRVTDCLIPRKRGIHTIHIEREQVNTSVLSRKQIYADRYLFPFINNNISRYSGKGDVFRWGYEILGPLLLGFTEWIHDELKANNISNACFLARDMNLILPIYSKLYPDSKAQVQYLEVSRRSIRREYIRSKKNFFSILDTLGRKPYKISELIGTIDISFSELKRKCLQANCNLEDDDIDIIQKNKPLSKTINEQILNLLDKPDYTSEYLQQFELYSQNDIALIDIGWHGTIQNMLESITGNKYLGLYLGNTIRSSFETMESKGYWFSNTDESESIYQMSIVGILEVALFPNIGTTVGYKVDDNGTILPLYADCEAADFSTIKHFQDGALKFIDDYLQYRNTDERIDANQAMAAYVQLAYRPSIKQAKVFSDLMYEDGKTNKLAIVNSWSCYLRHPKMLLKDYEKSKWKEGFIKQLFPFMTKPDKIDRAIKARYLK